MLTTHHRASMPPFNLLNERIRLFPVFKDFRSSGRVFFLGFDGHEEKYRCNSNVN